MAKSSKASDLILTLDAFVRAIGVNRGVPHALFLGAGASVTSAVPSAGTCIWEWPVSRIGPEMYALAFSLLYSWTSRVYH